MADLNINTVEVRKKLVHFIRNQVLGAGYSRAVVGVSGGVDSSLACYLTVEALQPGNVLAVCMPYRTSSPDSRLHADWVIKSTGVHSLTVSITDMVDGLFTQFPEADQIRRGNAMARARMIVLYDQSVVFNGLVVGTGNKTEFLLGYTTLYGDSACAFNPLGDLYKTQVRQLARAVGILQEIIDKPPSADLWVGQTDEDELGFTYEEVDRLLYLLIDQRYRPQDCIEAGFEADFVREVIERMRTNRFKRELPPIARISDRPMAEEHLYLDDF
ncbi:MAG: NAD+ synthase [Chloroflexota bacterium]